MQAAQAKQKLSPIFKRHDEGMNEKKENKL